MIRYAYNAQKQPPAPFVLVTVRHPRHGTEARDVPVQLDTGADRSLVPQAIVDALGLEYSGSLPVGGVGGKVEELALYTAELRIHTLSPRVIEVFAHPGEPWVLLGRDVLNVHRLLLDGPGLALEVG